MIKEFEFFNTQKKSGPHTIFRISVRKYFVLLELMDRIQKSGKQSVSDALRLEILKLTTDIKRPRLKDLSILTEVLKYNIPDSGEKKGSGKYKREDLYRNVMILIDLIVSQYPSASFPQVLDEWNMFQLMVAHNLIMRRMGIEYTELTSIAGLAKYKPKVLFDRYKKMVEPAKPTSSTISLNEAFRLSKKANQGGGHVEFH